MCDIPQATNGSRKKSITKFFENKRGRSGGREKNLFYKKVSSPSLRFPLLLYFKIQTETYFCIGPHECVGGGNMGGVDRVAFEDFGIFQGRVEHEIGIG